MAVKTEKETVTVLVSDAAIWFTYYYYISIRTKSTNTEKQ